MSPYRGPALQQRIRKIVTNNRTGDVYGITIPRVIAEQFSGCLLRIYVSGNEINLESGCKIEAKDINENIVGGFHGMRRTENEYGEMELVR